jgi:hypothetical protein
MADRKTTVEEVGKKVVYTQAFTIQGSARPVTAEETVHQRTVVTSLTEGVVSLRYAPRTPKASEPVNTDS